jgi:two-component system, OmpR family, KDP operon response regulator KdpE
VTPERGRILVVDDEPQITRVLRATLSSQGYDVRTAPDGEEALAVFAEWPADLVITDLSMPGMTGVELCRSLRKRTSIPIIVLSVRGDDRTKVQALDSGADDYVTKPFSSNELLARIRANLRRPNPDAATEAPIELGDFFIDPSGRVVRVRGKEVHLTPKEFELLVLLARSPGKVVGRRDLLAALWGRDSVLQPEYLRVFINQLRKKIEPGETPRYILTDPWVGYRFEPGGKRS